MHVILYKISIAALIAANALDSASSYGRPEANRLLATRGTFGNRALVIKSGGVTAAIFTLRHHRTAGTVVNFSAAGLFTGIAARNWRMK